MEVEDEHVVKGTIVTSLGGTRFSLPWENAYLQYVLSYSQLNLLRTSIGEAFKAEMLLLQILVPEVQPWQCRRKINELSTGHVKMLNDKR